MNDLRDSKKREAFSTSLLIEFSFHSIHILTDFKNYREMLMFEKIKFCFVKRKIFIFLSCFKNRFCYLFVYDCCFRPKDSSNIEKYYPRLNIHHLFFFCSSFFFFTYLIIILVCVSFSSSFSFFLIRHFLQQILNH